MPGGLAVAATPGRPRDNRRISEVTNLLLSFSVLEDEKERVREVDRWLVANDQLPLGNVWENEDAVGGPKRMEAVLYAGAFNYLDLQGLLMFLRTIAWEWPDEVQLLIRAQDDTRWRVIDA